MQPKNFGSYLLGNPFSATSIGELNRALPLDGQPAIRMLHVLPKELLGNANTRSLLLRNAKQWSSVKDLHTLGLLDLGEAEKTIFFAYEYEQGRLLSDILARCEQEGLPLSPDQAVYIIERLAGALLSVSASGSVYGCLSPQRVLVTFEGEVKLLPGVFRDIHTTPAADHPALADYRRFLIPGLAAGKSAKPSADRFALGALLFELLCRLPFCADGKPFDPGARLGEVQSGALGAEPLPEPILAILLKSCVPESPEVYTDLATMKADLDQLITSGEYSPTTFNIAFLMHTLFRGEDESDAAADKEFLSLDREKFRPAPPPPPPPEPAPVRRPESPLPSQVEEETLGFGLEPEKSKKGLFIGIGVAAAVVILVVLVYMAFFKQAGPSATETAAQEQLAKLQKEQQAMASKLKALEDEKAQLASQVTNAKTADEKAKAQKAFDEAQKKLQAQKEEQKRLADSALVTQASSHQASAAAKPPEASSPPPSTTAPVPVPSPAPAPLAANQPTSPAATTALPPPAPTPQSAPVPEKTKAGDFVELWGVDAKPKQLNQLRVDMPTVARQNRVSGTIYVEVLIDEAGQVTSAKVVKGLASDFGMNQACEEAASKLKYSPAFKDGVPVKTKMTFPILVK